MAHDKVYAVCENKCFVEILPSKLISLTYNDEDEFAFPELKKSEIGFVSIDFDSEAEFSSHIIHSPIVPRSERYVFDITIRKNGTTTQIQRRIGTNDDLYDDDTEGAIYISGYYFRIS